MNLMKMCTFFSLNEISMPENRTDYTETNWYFVEWISFACQNRKKVNEIALNAKRSRFNFHMRKVNQLKRMFSTDTVRLRWRLLVWHVFMFNIERGNRANSVRIYSLEPNQMWVYSTTALWWRCRFPWYHHNANRMNVEQRINSNESAPFCKMKNNFFFCQCVDIAMWENINEFWNFCTKFLDEYI